MKTPDPQDKDYIGKLRSVYAPPRTTDKATQSKGREEHDQAKEEDSKATGPTFCRDIPHGHPGA